MKILWHGSWHDAPCYSVPSRGRLITVDATCPLARVPHASGRIMRRPYRKAWRFVLMEGPSATYRKARTKQRELRFSGDYRIAAVLGTLRDSGARVVALACRVPPAAQHLPVHDHLVREVPDAFSLEEFERVAARLARDRRDLERLGSQTYLYSGQEPPVELSEKLDAALAASGRDGGVAPGVIRVDSPAASSSDPTLRRRFLHTVEGRVPVALLGAGDYARTQIVPALGRPELALVAVADREPQIAAFVADEAGFALATSDAKLAIDALPSSGIVVVATAHDSHAELAAFALSRGHRVFLEKPTVVTESDLERLVQAVSASGGTLAVGFNRRFNPLVRRSRALLAREEGPFTITCVVREVSLEPTHWYLWPNQGTRVAGNLCHWLDLSIYLMHARALPVSITVTPAASDEPQTVDEERALSVTFDDGSLLSIVATGRGDDIRGVQEFVDVRRGSLTITLDDLWRLTVLDAGRSRTRRTVFRDKGHARMFRESFDAFLAGRGDSYPLRDLVLVAVSQIAGTRLVQEEETQIWLEEDVRRWLARTVASEQRVPART